MEIVPPHDETCDVCAGKKDRPRQNRGKEWSERGMVRRICGACYTEYVQDVGVEPNVGPVRRKFELPDEPEQI